MLRRIRLTARFVRAALLRVPLYGFGGAAALLAVALLYTRSTSGQGLLTTIGDSSIMIFYPILGFIGGSLLGGAAAVRDTLAFFERQLPPWLDEVAASLGPDPFPSMPLAELRAHHDRTLDQMIASTVGAVPPRGSFSARSGAGSRTPKSKIFSSSVKVEAPPRLDSPRPARGS